MGLIPAWRVSAKHPGSFKKLTAADAEVKLYWTLKFPTAGMKLLLSRREAPREPAATIARRKGMAYSQCLSILRWLSIKFKSYNRSCCSDTYYVLYSSSVDLRSCFRSCFRSWIICFVYNLLRKWQRQNNLQLKLAAFMCQNSSW